MKPAFFITHDHTDDVPMLRMFGVGSAVNAGINRVYPFRLYDDDDNLYFSGVSTVPFSEMSSDYAFTPLDQYGAAYGCTYMEVLEDNKWSQL